MKLVLLANEQRVLGVLLEKQISTPEHYPLSLNALTNGCNQKTNRDPVTELDEKTVQHTVEDLVRKHLVSEKTGFGSRVSKYQHRFANTEFSELKFSEQEVAIICELFLRGPQTPGELRSHTARLYAFGDVDEVDVCLQALMNRDDGPFVKKLAKEPGRREARFKHLFCDDTLDAHEHLTQRMENSGSEKFYATKEDLEKRVAELELALEKIEARLSELESASQ